MVNCYPSFVDFIRSKGLLSEVSVLSHQFNPILLISLKSDEYTNTLLVLPKNEVSLSSGLRLVENNRSMRCV